VLRAGLQAVARGHDLIVRLGFADFAFGIDGVDREVAGSVEIEIEIEHVGVEANRGCTAPR